MPKYGLPGRRGTARYRVRLQAPQPSWDKRVHRLADLDPFFVELTRIEYPPDGDLQKRMPVPLFLQGGTHVVAIRSAVGDTRLINTVEEISVKIDPADLTGIGIILDADTASSPATGTPRSGTGSGRRTFPSLMMPGDVSATTPRFGAFVLPDNQAQGTLEDILLECGQQVYPGLFSTATTHVDAAFQDQSL